MKRIFALAVLLLSMPFALAAQEAAPKYVEGTHYVRLAQPVRTADPSRIEVTEVFWYGCIHCFHLEPLVNDWKKALKPDVDFQRSPAMWNQTMAVHAQAFYAAQALGVLEKLHGPLFAALNEERKKLDNEDELAAFFAAHGVKEADFRKMFNAFAVESSVKQADARARSYGITGTPELVVNGTYRISGRTAGSPADMLKVADFLVERERAARAAAKPAAKPDSFRCPPAEAGPRFAPPR
ncbi:MAG: thiol:disulfide interchange protein DsbA/DsbL [Gammaproteobacteria bacterium]|nr:thiol:disulfide interchange protein DsbA/DsbL [Gammaproteobacteria bacterium]